MTTVAATLVMTVLDEAESLPGFLADLRHQTVLPGEVVVVDGGSTDGTLELLRAWEPPDGTVSRVLSVPGANISQGRNIAVAAASHELVLVTDAGTTLDHRWVELLHGALDDGADVASGFFAPTGATPFQLTLARTITPLLSEVDPQTFLPSSRSVAFAKKHWHAVGGYPEWLDYCEDLVFDLALRDNGARFVFVPDAVATWSARPTMSAFAKQYFRYARGDGKAGLWPKRHAARYAAYAVALVVLGSRSTWATVALLAAGALYLAKFVRRALAPRDVPSVRPAQAVVRVPLIVLVGDLAKMAGYPAGLLWRARRQGRGGRGGDVS